MAKYKLTVGSHAFGSNMPTREIKTTLASAEQGLFKAGAKAIMTDSVSKNMSSQLSEMEAEYYRLAAKVKARGYPGTTEPRDLPDSIPEKRRLLQLLNEVKKYK